jgi:enoyl-CoA hydratase/carnithine racemase
VTSYDTLLVSKDDGIAWVSLNRPAVRNAINARMQGELRQAWDGFRYDADVRCIVLTGGGESFCTGIDRAEAVSAENTDSMAAGSYPGYPTPWMYDDPGRDIGPKTRDVWKPVVAAVHGMAYGGSCYMLGEVRDQRQPVWTGR